MTHKINFNTTEPVVSSTLNKLWHAFSYKNISKIEDNTSVLLFKNIPVVKRKKPLVIAFHVAYSLSRLGIGLIKWNCAFWRGFEREICAYRWKTWNI